MMSEDRYTNTEADAGSFEAARSGMTRREWAEEQGFEDELPVMTAAPVPPGAAKLIDRLARERDAARARVRRSAR